MPGPDFLLRDVEVGDAEALARILITANEAAFRGRSPDQCLTLTEVQRAANWRRTLVPAPGDFLVVVRATILGKTHQGTLMGFAPTGKAVSVALVDISRVADGRLAERWAVADTLGMLHQLGAIPGQA